jgi:hypothetical protein
MGRVRDELEVAPAPKGARPDSIPVTEGGSA